jgi:5-methylcytosine-specific restriction endonuclease McrA
MTSALTSAGSTRTWRRLRRFVLARDGYACQVPVDDAGRLCRALASHVDHIVPRVAGGTDDPANLRAACQPCNLRRGAGHDETTPSHNRPEWTW